MILGNNPTGHAFVVKDLVFIELSGHAPRPTWGRGRRRWGWGVKNFRKNLAGGGVRNCNFGGGGGGVRGGGSRNFEVKIKTA